MADTLKYYKITKEIIEDLEGKIRDVDNLNGLVDVKFLKEELIDKLKNLNFSYSEEDTEIILNYAYDPVKVIEDNRDLILMAEIGAYLHDLGKLSQEFIDSKKKDSSTKWPHHLILKRNSGYLLRYLLKDVEISCLKSINPLIATIFKKILPEYPQFFNIVFSNKIIKLAHKEKPIEKFFLNSQLKKILEDPLPVLSIPNHASLKQVENLGDFIDKHHETAFTPPWLINWVLIKCDETDSKIDKGSVKTRQSKTYLSNAFGYEKELKEFNITKNNCHKKIIAIFNDKKKVCELREEIFKEIPQCFSEALGETRRSANDITLEDHSFSTSTLLKSILIERILNNKFDTGSSFIQWKIMSICWNSFEFISRSIKVQQILERRKIISDIKKSLKKFIQVDLPLGNCIYEDEDGIFFLIPNLDYDNNPYNKIKKYIINKSRFFFTQKTENELEPYISFQKSATKTLTSLVQERSICMKEVLSPFRCHPSIEWIKKWEEYTGVRDICPSCRLRPRVMKRIENPEGECDFCSNLRTGRSETWLKNINDKNTIWLGEVSDKNNQVALITGRFDLNDWLNGILFPTVFSTNLIEWKKKLNGDIENHCNLHEIACLALGKAIQNYLRDDMKQETFYIFNTFFSKDRQINKKKAKEEIQTLREQEIPPLSFIPTHLINSCINLSFKTCILSSYHNLYFLNNYFELPNNIWHWLNLIFRKHPSPARLRRIWKSTEEFISFITGKKNIEKWLLSDSRPEIYRLKIQTVNNLKSTENNFILNLNSTNIEVFYDKQNKALYTIDNLCKYSEDIKKEITLKDESGKPIDIESFEEISYIPYIPVLLSPITFQFIVPADKAFSVIEKIKKEYDERFGKVKNRLPFHIGAVFFKYKTPLYIAIDASRRMLKNWIEFGKTDSKNWMVVCKPEDDPNIHMTKLEVKKLSKNDTDLPERKVKINVNWQFEYSQTDNGKIQFKKEYYYPYFFVNRENNDFSKSETYSKVPSPGAGSKDIIHVSELQKDDIVELEPSYFDFEFLDSTIRRYDITKPRKHFICGIKSPRPYYLEELGQINETWSIISSLKITQAKRKNLQSLLINKIYEWDSEEFDFRTDEQYKNFINYTVKNVFEDLITDEEKQVLITACQSGMIFDILELFEKLSS